MSNRGRAPAFRSPLRIRLFRNVWIANLCSNFGALVQGVAASWTMTTLGASPLYVALVQASTSLPIMLLSLIAGAIADNFDRRCVMLCAQSLMLAISALLAVSVYLGVATPWLLLASTFLVGCGTALNGPAWQASVADMVPRDLLPEAVTYNSMGFSLARSAGPALGGLIVAVAGAGTAFLANAFSYVGLIAVLAKWRPDIPARRLPPESLVDAMGAGIRYAAMSPPTRTVLFRAVVFGFAGSALLALLPLVARDLLHSGVLTYAALLCSFGVGAVMGAVAGLWLRHRISAEAIVRLSALALATGAGVAGSVGWLPLLCLALTFAGAGWVMAMSMFNVTVQMTSPRWVAARTISLYQMAAFGGMAAGSWLFGVLASRYGVSQALTVAAVAQLANVALGGLRPMPEVSEPDPPFEME